eukprot:7076198-Prymnesium_polylepis.1
MERADCSCAHSLATKTVRHVETPCDGSAPAAVLPAGWSDDDPLPRAPPPLSASPSRLSRGCS